MIGGGEDGMAEVRDRDRPAAPAEAPERRARPVVLATLSVRIDPAAEEMAIASALEAGVPLIVANMLHLPPYPATVMLVGAENATLPHEEALEEVRATAARAAALGIPTELLRVSSRRPVRALLQLVAERDAGLLVFGPSSGRIRGPRLRAAERRVRRDAPCLVWVAPDG
jgi:nucleotide-binding universal stress UspA family protein